MELEGSGGGLNVVDEGGEDGIGASLGFTGFLSERKEEQVAEQFNVQQHDYTVFVCQGCVLYNNTGKNYDTNYTMSCT